MEETKETKETIIILEESGKTRPFTAEEMLKMGFGRRESRSFHSHLSAERRYYDYEKGMLEDIRLWLETISFEEFYAEIAKRVIGQEELKYVVFNVYQYLQAVSHQLPVNNNMILCAPSGCGKTETYRAMRDYFKEAIPELPVCIYDLSQITAAGWRGADPTSLLEPFFEKRVEDAIGILFLDEFDKKVIPSFNVGGQDVNKEVQGNLLTIFEGGTFYKEKNRSSDDRPVCTERIMFVALGSFDQFRQEKEDVANPIGLGIQELWEEREADLDHYKGLERDDMVASGATNEIIGRFPIIVNYGPLTRESVEKIIAQIRKRVAESFSLSDVLLSDVAYEELFELANSKYGCRLLESKVKEAVLRGCTDAMLLHPTEKILAMELISLQKAVPITEWDVEGEGCDADSFIQCRD